jgi:threonine dehydrogenase-like Zn-dependent dehydrogenase
VLAGTGADLTVLGKHPEKLKLLQDLGIDARQSYGGPMGWADVVVEATGRPDALQQALDLVRPRGTLILKSTHAGRASIDMSLAVVNEVTVMGSRCGPFPPALDALARKSVHVRPQIQDILPLEDGVRAMALAGRPGTRKILLNAKES